MAQLEDRFIEVGLLQRYPSSYGERKRTWHLSRTQLQPCTAAAWRKSFRYLLLARSRFVGVEGPNGRGRFPFQSRQRLPPRACAAARWGAASESLAVRRLPWKGPTQADRCERGLLAVPAASTCFLQLLARRNGIHLVGVPTTPEAARPWL